MHRHFRLSSYLVSSLAVVTALVGCGSEAAEEPTGPAPTESTVFEASKETTAELGIAKWGYESGNNGDYAKYRGYGARNQVIAEIERKVDRTDPNKWKFSLTATGSAGSAKETIDFDFKEAKSGDYEAYATVKENTFTEGSGPAKALARFKVDGAVFAAADPSGPASLIGSAGDGLVDRCQELTSKCNRLLIRDEIAADGQSSECGLLRTIGVPLLGGLIGAGAGALAGAGVGAIPGAAIGALAGSGTQAALCIDAQLAARRARADFTKCQQDQSAAGCTVTR